MDDRHKPDTKFQHNIVENVKTEAYCSAAPESAANERPNVYRESKSLPILGPELLRLALRADGSPTERLMQDGPRPSDFGEHEPIPEEAVIISPVDIGDDSE